MTDRWARALHNAYLVTLAVPLVAALGSIPAGAGWLVIGVVTAVLALADACVRRWPAFGYRGAVRVGYFSVTGVVLAALASVNPAFAMVSFGFLPLAFALLPRLGAVAMILITTAPFVIQPHVVDLLTALGWQPPMMVMLGPPFIFVVSVVLPLLTGLFIAGAVRALRQTRTELAAASRLAGQAEERQRLAHELHDTLAQGLSGVVLQLEAAEEHLDRHATVLLIARARETARCCLADTRRAVEALRPERLDEESFADALAHVCLQWSQASGVPARPVLHGPARRFHPRVEVVALRVVQEALANAGKHAGAGELTVSVEYTTGELRLTVCDDGRGFDPGNPPRPNGYTSGGLGLATMRERVASVGGRLAVTSAPGAGTIVTATLPDVGAPTMVGAGR